MYSTQSMRKFVCDRLTEVAQEILGAFESKVVDYEAEIRRQRRLLEKVFTPQLKLHRTDLETTQCKKEQDDWNQQHDNNETNSNLRPPDVIHVKEEQEEICIQYETPHAAQVQDTCASNLTPGHKASDCSDQSQCLNPHVSQMGANEDPQPDHSSNVISSVPAVSVPNGDQEVLPHKVEDTTAASRIEPNQTEICASQSASTTNICHVTSVLLIDNYEKSTKTTEVPANAAAKIASTENTEPKTNESCSKTTTADRCTDLISNVENTGENPLLNKQSEPAVNKETFDGKQTSAGCVDSTSDRSAEPPPTQGCNEDSARSSQSIKLDKESSKGKTTASTSGNKQAKSNTSTAAEKRKSSDGIPTSSTSSTRKRAIPSGSLPPKDEIRSSDGIMVSPTRSNKKVKLTEKTDRTVSKKGKNMEKYKSVDTELAPDSTSHQEIPSTRSNTAKDQTTNGKAREEKTATTLSCKSVEEGKNKKSSAADSSYTKSSQNETSSITNTESPSTEPTQNKKPGDEKVRTKVSKSAQNPKSNDQRTKSTRTGELKGQKSKSRNVASSRSKEGTPGHDESATSSESATRRKTRRDANASMGRKEETHKKKTTSKESGDPAPSEKGNAPSDKMDDDENPYKCDRCGKVMSNIKNYKFHMRTHTVDKTFKCDVCGKMFRDSWDLNKHVVIHSTKKPFKCKVCGSGFNRIYNLDLHLRVHTGEKPYKCDTCEKCFSSLVNLKKHIRIHTGEKPYTCEDCGKGFTDSSAFRNHQRVHTGEKPFKCTHCKRRFTTRDTLKKHSRTHTGEKPYVCDVCHKAFAYKADLNRHARLHTGEKPYECTTCGEKFSTWSLRDKHRRKHITDPESAKD